MKRYYLYRHTRKDKNEVFYIGVGTYETNIKYKTTKYKRAFEKSISQRPNVHWQGIVNKSEYEVEILMESHDLEFIFRKEIEFIKIYGRRGLGEGTLCNFDDGGKRGGRPKIKLSQQKLMKKNSWVKGKFGSDHHLSQEVFVYSIKGDFINKFGGYREAADALGIHYTNIRLVLKGECQQCFGMVFKKEYLGEKIPEIIIQNKKIRKVDCFDLEGNFIKNFESVTLAAKEIGSQTTHISNACKNFNRSCKGFRWKYTD